MPSKNKKKFQREKMAAIILLIVAIALVIKAVAALTEGSLELAQVETGTVYPHIEGEGITLRYEYVVTAPVAGTFTPSLHAGERVKKNGVIGVMQQEDADSLNNTSTPVYIQEGGVVFYQLDGWEDILRPGAEDQVDWLRLLTLIREQFAVEDGENAIIEETASGEVGIEDGEAGPPNLAADRPIARIVDNLLDFQIFFYAGENDVDALEEGQRVKIRWDENEESLTQAQVIEKGALEDGASYVLLSVSSAEERLFSQRYALCQLVVEGLNGLTVPSSAVFQEDAKDYVFIRKKNYVTQQEVEVVYSDENITMVEGLTTTDFVVVNPQSAFEGKQID